MTAERKKMDVCGLLMVFLGAVFLVNGTALVYGLIQGHRQEETYRELRRLFADGISGAEEANADMPCRSEGGGASPQEWKSWWEKEAAGRLPVYRSMAEKNADMVGWVRIEGTAIDYPVCQTPEDPEFYLHRDINRERADCGTPFLDSICRLGPPRSSLLVYGHHMQNGQMFASLCNYMDQGYFLEHPYIQFDTLEEAGSYEIAAIVTLEADGGQVPWLELLFPSCAEEFTDAWQAVEQCRLYDIDVEPKAKDGLLALVTCEYTQKNGRLMVIARKIP